MLGLDTLEAAERMKAEMMDDRLRYGDNFIRNWSHWFIAWDYMYRGLLKEAREAAIQLFASGEERNDPRAIGMANWLIGWICIIGDLYDVAESYGEECLRVAIAPHDRLQGAMSRLCPASFWDALKRVSRNSTCLSRA